MNSGLLHLFLEIVVIGLVVWVVNTYTPIPEAFKKVILVVGVLFCIVLACATFGVRL